MKRTKEPSEQLQATFKTEYQKQGVNIMTGGLSDSLLGFAFELKTGTKMSKTIVTNGKLRRAVRRAIVKKLLYALETGYLGKIVFYKKANTRGVFIFRKDWEAKNETK